MSYTPNISLQLDIDYAGIAADLRGQLYDGATQATVGGAISGVFFERPGAQAMYIMRPSIPNGHDGWCDIYIDGAPETVIGFFQINPAELENTDAKISDIIGTNGANLTALAAQSSLDDLSAKIGNPDGVSVSADIAQLATNLNDVANAVAALNNLSADEAKAAIMQYLMMDARQFQDVIMDLWAVWVGDSDANDATNPTVVNYQNVVTGGQVTHILTPTTRTRD